MKDIIAGLSTSAFWFTLPSFTEEQTTLTVSIASFPSIGDNRGKQLFNKDNDESKHLVHVGSFQLG